MAAHRKGVLEFDGVQIKPSSVLLAFLTDFCQSCDYETSLKDEVKRSLDNIPVRVPYKLLKSVRNAARDTSVSASVSLHELLDGSELCLPSPVIPPRNPELESRVQRLRNQQLNREYDKMTASVDPGRRSATSVTAASHLGSDLRQVKQQSIAVVNFLVSVGGTFAFFYKAVEYALPDPHIPVQVLAGLFAAIVVAVAELYFVIKVI